MHHLEYYNETNTEHKTLTLQLRSAAMTWQGGNRFVRGVYQAYIISCLVQGDYTRYNLVVVASEFLGCGDSEVGRLFLPDHVSTRRFRSENISSTTRSCTYNRIET